MENHSDVRGNCTNNQWNLLGGLLVGGMAGAMTMLLMAPQSGKKTRAKIRMKSIELRNQAADTIEDVLDETRDKVHHIKKSVNNQAEAIQQRGQELVEAGSMKVQGVLGSHTSGK